MKEQTTEIRSVYLAGELKKWDWRHTVVQGLKYDLWNWQGNLPFPVVESAIYGKFDYVGPFWPYSKCPNDADDHHSAEMYRQVYLGDRLTEEDYWRCCRDAIDRADLVACVFGDNRKRDAWTGASELLYAASVGKQIVSIDHSPFSQMVSETLPQCGLGSARHPRLALANYLGITSREINRDNGNGFVYFIESFQTQQIKIGWAYDPIRRLKEFQTGSPTEYTLLGTLPGNRTLERKLHLDFAEFHVRGEWFFGVMPLRKFINEVVVQEIDRRTVVDS